jgi:hypothetical protein
LAVKSTPSALLGVLLLAVSLGTQAADSWNVEAYGGTAYNLKNNRLKITQDGGFSETVNADYDTRGFRAPPYYMLRGSRWQGGAAWEFSLIHHKLYLRNPPPGVSGLSVSHGFNLLSVNRAFQSDAWIYRLGAGPVVTHAEATILGTKYDGPYRLAGVALLAGAGRRFYLAERTFIGVEAALTAAYAKPKLSGPPQAELSVKNTAAHLLFGLGYEL